MLSANEYMVENIWNCTAAGAEKIVNEERKNKKKLTKVDRGGGESD